jgi:hypothetical protein
VRRGFDQGKDRSGHAQAHTTRGGDDAKSESCQDVLSRGSLEALCQGPGRICSIFQTSLFSIIRFSSSHAAAYVESQDMQAAQFRDRWRL